MIGHKFLIPTWQHLYGQIIAVVSCPVLSFLNYTFFCRVLPLFRSRETLLERPDLNLSLVLINSCNAPRNISKLDSLSVCIEYVCMDVCWTEVVLLVCLSVTSSFSASRPAVVTRGTHQI